MTHFLGYFQPICFFSEGCKTYIDDGMLSYLENTDQCRRKILFSDMERLDKLTPKTGVLHRFLADHFYHVIMLTPPTYVCNN